MDISTCRKNLSKQRYGSYKEFFADIQLIWDNCKQYNVQGSDIYELAIEMEKHAKKLVAKTRRQLAADADIVSDKNVSKATVNIGSSKQKKEQQAKEQAASS